MHAYTAQKAATVDCGNAQKQALPQSPLWRGNVPPKEVAKSLVNTGFATVPQFDCGTTVECGMPQCHSCPSPYVLDIGTGAAGARHSGARARCRHE